MRPIVTPQQQSDSVSAAWRTQGRVPERVVPTVFITHPTNDEDADMRNLILGAVILLGSALVLSSNAFGEGDLSKQDAITVQVDLGREGASEHRFYPDELTFETGKLYRLVLHNPSNSKHYFTSLGFASMIWTRKVQVMDDIGPGAKTIAEVKGPVREVEVYPGGTTEWWFVPVAAGTVTDLHCHIVDQDGKSHGAKGMEGTIIIL